ncbi:MAG TPA: hypothetical protein VIG06_09645 [Kofleriaceae bacterium]|jgi:hypothetical protein
MNRKTPRTRRLALHRETLRGISQPDLGRVAGGTFVPELEPFDTGQPKTNAWTGSFPGEAFGNLMCERR